MRSFGAALFSDAGMRTETLYGKSFCLPETSGSLTARKPNDERNEAVSRQSSRPIGVLSAPKTAEAKIPIKKHSAKRFVFMSSVYCITCLQCKSYCI